jgi:hypothetical protein
MAEQESPKMTWQEWQAVALAQGLLAVPAGSLSNKTVSAETAKTTTSSVKDQALAYHLLQTQLASYPCSEKAAAIIEAYQGAEDDYQAKMLWMKRAHLLDLLPSVDEAELANKPTLHQVQLKLAKSDKNFDVESTWQVMQDVLEWRRVENEAQDRAVSLQSLAENTPINIRNTDIDSADQQKSSQRWQELKELRSEENKHG